MRSRTYLLISSLTYFIAMIFVRASGYTLTVDILNIIAMILILVGLLKIQKERKIEKISKN